MRLIFQILLVLTALIIGLLLLIRIAPMRAERWHVDPEVTQLPSTPNYHLICDVDCGRSAVASPLPLTDTAEILDRIIMARPHVTRLAGSAESGLVTYVERTPLFRFPDAISVRLTEVEAGTRMSILSRSRYGYSDMGANRARVEAIVSALTAALPADAP